MIQPIQVELLKVPYSELLRKYEYAKLRMSQLSEKEHLTMYEKWLYDSFYRDYTQYTMLIDQANMLKRDFVYMVEGVVIDYSEGDRIMTAIQAKTKH